MRPDVGAGNPARPASYNRSVSEGTTRPNSLFPPERPLQPEKQPLKFDVNLVGAPPEVEQLVNNIKQVAEEFLYHWKTFPIVLPCPLGVTSQPGAHHDTNHRPKRLNLQDLFLAPSFDELDAVAVDSKGEPRRLSHKQLECIRERGLHKDKYSKAKMLNSSQLESIRRRGEFEVASLNFPGQVHRWQLSLLLQRGFERSRECLLDDLARAITLVLVTGKARLTSDTFSVRESLKGLLLGLTRLLDIVLGMPSLLAHNLDNKIKEERCRYLVAELVCCPEYNGSLSVLCGFIRRQIRRAVTEKFEVERECSRPPCSVPYLYQTPQGTHIDLRLFKRDIMRRALPILINILEKETRGWFLHFRERLIAELRAQKMPDSDIEKEVKEAVMREYLQRVYNSVLAHPGLAALGSGIPELLVKQAQATVMMHRAVDNVQRKLDRTKDNLRDRLENMHPVLSRIRSWIEDKLRTAEEAFIHQNAWNAHQEAVALCTAHGLTQASYFLQRDLAFMKEGAGPFERAAEGENSDEEFPVVDANMVPHQLDSQTELPRTIRSHTDRSDESDDEHRHAEVGSKPAGLLGREGDRENDDDQVADVEMDQLLPQNYDANNKKMENPTLQLFVAEHTLGTVIIHEVQSALFLFEKFRTWSWSWNAMFLFGVVIPWCSPVSLRALFFMEPFMPDLELSQVNGTLFPRKSSITPTACSRLISLWRHISKSRTNFETKPDTGFIGKGLTRHINRVWNYVIKGTFGTIGILVLFPLACLLVAILSLLAAATTFVWMPVVTLILHILMVTIYDLDSPDYIRRNRFFIIIEAVIWNIFVQGCIQPVLALFVGFFLCPIASFLLFAVALIRYWTRLGWDALMFQCVIKKRGRIPSSDSAFVKRIAGPGLAHDYYFQIRPEQALAAMESRMELDELAAFQQTTEAAIVQPQKDFAQFVEACFGPFSVQLAKTGPYKQLEKECGDLISSLHEKLERRRRELSLGLSQAVCSKIKLNTVDLKVVIQQAALMLSRFYPAHVISRLSISEEEYWDSRGLSPNDWVGLAGLLYADLFGLDFLTPLGEADTRFRLDPHQQVDLSRYADLVHTTEIVEGGPDLLGTVYSPRGNITVQPPCLDVTAFNPRSRLLTTPKEKRSDVNPTLSWVRGTLPRPNRRPWLGWNRARRRHVTTSRPSQLPVPLPVPHPVTVALIIYNRDAESPILLDSDICIDILRTIEEASYDADNTQESVARFRTEGTIADSSIDSLDTSSDGEVEGTAGTDETPVQQQNDLTDANEECQRETLPCAETGFHWTLTNWGQGRRRNQSGTVRVDLASPEDVTLDTDSTRVVFTSYGTSV